MISFDESKHILSDLEANGDATLVEQLLAAAVRYAAFRARWAVGDSEARKQMDGDRTRAHDAFIDCCNILSRSMRREGHAINWRESLGNDRKTVGDFACLLVCHLSLRAR